MDIELALVQIFQFCLTNFDDRNLSMLKRLFVDIFDVHIRDQYNLPSLRRLLFFHALGLWACHSQNVRQCALCNQAKTNFRSADSGWHGRIRDII